MDISELNKLYQDSDTEHRRLHSEMRSNLMLVAGNHYNKQNSRFWRNVRTATNLSRNQRLRLTKNHVQKITKTYVNNLLHYAPGVTIGPKNASEIQDRKAAELNLAVWQDIKERHKFKRIVYRLANDFIKIGEAWIKIFWDDNIGQFLGYDPATDEEGELILDENGEPVGEPFTTGDLVYEVILGFNVFSDPGARSEEESRWHCIQKMEDIKTVKKRYADREDIQKMIEESSKATWKLFDGSSGEYSDKKGLVKIREFYFKPSAENPEGKYYICLENGILHEGELPLGLYPILKCGFDDLETSCRSQSIIKQLRPYQAEVNRCASALAETQITLGMDKIITQKGAGVTVGGQFHGIRELQVAGPAPTILPGRSGEQYLGYMQSQIAEMYQISNIMEDVEEAKQLDPYAMLFRSLKEKKRFTIYSDKFEDFLKDICAISLELKRAYARDEEIIPAIGRNEAINIAEFRGTEDLMYEVKIEPQAEDVETKMGRQLMFNHILQYAGNKLPPDELGKIIKNMPYANQEEVFGDFTIDYENATNDILMIERGEPPQVSPHQNHAYTLKRITHRMKQPDFRMLDQQIQQLFMQYHQQLTQLLTQQTQELAKANSGFIPSGGGLVAADIYVPKPGDPSKQQRARIPQEALQWLLERLAKQGSTQEMLGQQSQQSQLAILQGGQGGQPAGPGQGQPAMLPGQARPV